MEEDKPLKEDDFKVFYDDITWAPCSLGRACSFLMLPFVFGIVGLTYVPYVKHFAAGGFLGSVCLLIFHLLLGLMLTSYFQVIVTDPGTVPSGWAAQVATSARPAYKKCRYTHVYRPLRSHYCSITKRPVLNLDHFCPWVANAVGFKNRKFFVLFCFYSMLTSAFAAVTLGPYALSLKVSAEAEDANSIDRAMALMAFIMDTTFAFALSLFSIGHFYMASRNQTSLEDSRASKRYDLGWFENMQTVFGIDHRFWFVPIHRSPLLGDGVHWKLHNGSWDGHASKLGPFDDNQA